MDYFFGKPYPREVEHNRLVADGLNQNPAVMSAVIRTGFNFRIYLDPDGDDRDWYLSASARVFTKPLWDCSVAVAQCLLALPMPTDE